MNRRMKWLIAAASLILTGCILFVGVMTMSGWDFKKGVKPTILAVPQGSVYLFRCVDKVAAKNLIARLHLQRQSDEGPKGFGIGLCSIVSPDSPTAVGRGPR